MLKLITMCLFSICLIGCTHEHKHSQTIHHGKSHKHKFYNKVTPTSQSLIVEEKTKIVDEEVKVKEEPQKQPEMPIHRHNGEKKKSNIFNFD